MSMSAFSKIARVIDTYVLIPAVERVGYEGVYKFLIACLIVLILCVVWFAIDLLFFTNTWWKLVRILAEVVVIAVLTRMFLLTGKTINLLEQKLKYRGPISG